MKPRTSELPGLARDADQRRYADKLVKVRTRRGQHDLVYVHVEVQVSTTLDFAQRMLSITTGFLTAL